MIVRATECLRGRRWVALTGAGMSTDSGIPDYRSPGRPPTNPIQGPAFDRDPAVRVRYWARSMRGWPALRAAVPNAAHHALVEAERAGLELVLTQNVDGLHGAAGSRAVVELHGALVGVVCRGCAAWTSRDAVQARLEALNGPAGAFAAVRADGDAELPAPGTEAHVDPPGPFHVPDCERCGGILKPDVVFFGDNVPAARVAAAYAAIDTTEAVLVAGSSLTVWSGYRFVRRAAERGIPVVVVNRGPTRGDPLATVRIDGPLGEVLPELVSNLVRGDGAR